MILFTELVSSKNKKNSLSLPVAITLTLSLTLFHSLTPSLSLTLGDIVLKFLKKKPSKEYALTFAFSSCECGPYDNLILNNYYVFQKQCLEE